MKAEVFGIHPVFDRPDFPTAVEEGNVDSAGYRPIAAMVHQFREAGIQLEVFRSSEFDGDLEVNPLYRVYIDPVDRDKALTEAAARAEDAVKKFEEAKRAAIDKRNQQFEDRVVAAAEARRRLADAQSEVSSETEPSVRE